MHQNTLDHISKEIETTLNNTYLFRTRSAFTVWVGPFILLGAVIVAGKSKISLAQDLGGWFWGAVILSFLSYLALGFIAGLIEKANWVRLDQLRSLHLSLSDNSDLEAHSDAFRDQNRIRFIVRAYLVVFALVAVVFFCATVIVSHLEFSA